MPDFGIMRGFGSKLFSDKLVAGQLPTQLGLIGSENFGFDPDAVAFFTRVTNDGGSLSNTEKVAVNQLVLDMKSYGIWSAMKAVYPMVGASADACKQNLKSASFTGTFSTGWTFASTGVKGNGTSTYYDTQFKPSVDSLTDSASLSLYARNIVSENKLPIGCRDNSGTFELLPGFSGTTTYFVPNVGSDSFSFSASTNSQGFFQAIRQGAAACIGLRNSTIYSANQNQYRPPYNVLIGASNVLGSPSNYSNLEFAFVSIGDSLTNTQASNFYTAVQAFQTTLSRQV